MGIISRIDAFFSRVVEFFSVDSAVAVRAKERDRVLSERVIGARQDPRYQLGWQAAHEDYESKSCIEDELLRHGSYPFFLGYNEGWQDAHDVAKRQKRADEAAELKAKGQQLCQERGDYND